jgi:energy-coupling factor transporter ATP-binding protein EcfA2
MTEISGFPRELLKQPPQARRTYFDAYTAGHPLLREASEALQQAILDAGKGAIIMVYGPTGVGKTTLLKRIDKYLTEKALAELEEDRERFPVVYIRTATPDSARFDWRDYFRRLLINMREPAVDRKIDVQKWEPHHIEEHLIKDDKTAVRRLRYAAEQSLKHRRPLAVLVDEAQHFGIVGSGQKLLNQLNVIKSVADDSETTHVLCGTYELLPFRNLNGQLSRRSFHIHFPRYHVDRPEERAAFINILYTFQHHLPLPEMPDLAEREWDFLYERSIGCVGILKDWLSRALAKSLRRSGKTLTRDHLEKTAPSVAECMKQLTEAVEGERQLTESEESRSLLRQHLGLDRDVDVPASKVPAPESTGKSRSKNRRVGTRLPVRDTVGEKVA